MGKRLLYLDTAGGLLLCHMVLWHCSQFAGVGNEYERYTLCLSFFMPWFFFKAGMMHKATDVKATAVSGWHRLMMPYIIFTLVGAVPYFIKACIVSHTLTPAGFVYDTVRGIAVYGAAPCNLALWFLPSLLVVKIMHAWAMRSSWLRWSLFALMLVASIVVATCHGLLPHSAPLYMFNIPAGYVFYASGHALCGYRAAPWTLCACILVFGLVMYLSPTLVDMRDGCVKMGSIFCWYPLCLAGIISINGLCRLALDNRNVLSYVGRHTMPYYCMHWIVIVTASMLIPATITGWTRFGIYAAACVVALPVASTLYLRIFPEKRRA